jgi:nitroreductase
MPHLGLTADEVLTTTRAVRKRLDLTRPVDPEELRECLEIALQAPTGANRQNWHFVVVTNPTTIAALGDLYRRGIAGTRDANMVLTRIEPSTRCRGC